MGKVGSAASRIVYAAGPLGLGVTVGLAGPALAECMGRCADRIGYFLGALALLPVLLIVVLVAYFTGRPMLAKLAGAAIVIDLIVLWKNS